MNFTTRFISKFFLLIAFAVVSASSVFAQVVPDSSPVSDQKPGSVLIFNYYGSKITNPKAEDTEINITNTNTQKMGTAAIFFIDSVSGHVADASVCLAANQTISFLTSDMDPGAKGYILVVSVDAATGQPNYFNYFTGSESIKTEYGYLGSLNVETIAAMVASPAGAPSGTTATLMFDGVHYNKVPASLILDHIPSVDGWNQTLVIVNQIGGSLVGNNRPDDLTALYGVMYDMSTKAYYWQVGNLNSFQSRKVIADDFPKTTPGVSTVLADGAIGWMKFWPVAANKGITGAVLYLNKSTSPAVSRFTGGRNLHHLTMTTDQVIIPVYPKNC